MAISAGAAVFQYGTQTTVISDSSAIANGAFNAGTITALTQTDYCPLGDAVLTIQFSVAPSTYNSVYLFRRDLNIDGTTDAPVPDSNFRSTYLGTLVVDKVSTVQTLQLTDIPLVIDQEFYIQNGAGQSTTGTTVLKVTPKSYNIKV